MDHPWYQIFGLNVLWGPFWGLMGGFGGQGLDNFVSGPLVLDGEPRPQP